MDHTCFQCGAPLARKTHVRRSRIGRFTVEDGSTMVPVCANGHAEIDLRMLERYELRAARTVMADAAELTGAEVRAIRKVLGMTQTEFANHLDTTQETVSRWETDKATLSKPWRAAIFGLLTDPEGFERMERAHAKPGEVLKVQAA